MYNVLYVALFIRSSVSILPGNRCLKSTVGIPNTKHARAAISIGGGAGLLGRAHLLKLDQQQDVVDAFDDAADEQRPAKARKRQQVARDDRARRPGEGFRNRRDTRGG